MLEFLISNLATIIIGAVILAAVILIILKLRRDRKKANRAAAAAVRTARPRAFATKPNKQKNKQSRHGSSGRLSSLAQEIAKRPASLVKGADLLT